MQKPTITCPNYRHETKLTGPLAAPLIEDVKKGLKHKLKGLNIVQLRGPTQK
tara:strand:- start:2780 stop:2935 length:156 start_codon:yes stop_codon:yes gene_type:complete